MAKDKDLISSTPSSEGETPVIPETVQAEKANKQDVFSLESAPVPAYSSKTERFEMPKEWEQANSEQIKLMRSRIEPVWGRQAARHLLTILYGFGKNSKRYEIYEPDNPKNTGRICVRKKGGPPPIENWPDYAKKLLWATEMEITYY